MTRRAGEYHDEALAGDRLVGGVYEPIAIDWTDAEHGRGYSAALGLYVCWEREELRFYDPVAERYVRTLADEAAERRAEAVGRRLAEARADAEAARADAEAHARRLAEGPPRRAGAAGRRRMKISRRQV